METTAGTFSDNEAGMIAGIGILSIALICAGNRTSSPNQYAHEAPQSLRIDLSVPR
jgi:hypothetical protein